MSGASPTLLQPVAAPHEARLTTLAASVAGALDEGDLVERLAAALAADDHQRVSIRLWLVREGGRPILVAQQPRRSKQPRGEPEAVVAAALSTDPLRTRSAVLVALQTGGAPLGVLAVGARSGADPALLAELAPIAAARLAALQDSHPDRSPSASIRRVEAAADIQSVIASFAADARQMLDHDRLSVYMLTPDGRSFERFAVATSPVLPGESDVAPLEDVGLTYVLRSNQTFVSDDLATDERLVGREDSVIAAAGFHGLVSVPLRVAGEPIGLLNFVSHTVGFYNDDDGAVAQQIADQVAIFFQNLRLEQRIRLAIEREAGQQERNRLAHEFHDTLAQSLAELLAELDLLSRRLGALDPNAERDVTAMRERTRLMLDELRRSLLRLGPAELDRRSLPDAMANVLEQLEAEHGIKANLEVVGPARTVPIEVETTVFRIFQEALTNARKHASASAVNVVLRVGEGLTLSVDDNGSGFAGCEMREGFGMGSMRARAEEIGGRLVVSSTAGQGTSVNLTVPSLRPGQTPAAGSGPALPTRSAGPPGRVLRVLVVDDHPLFREAVSRVLDREADIRVIGQVGTSKEVLEAVRRLRPDIVLLDVELPDGSGINVARSVTPLDSAPGVLMMSAFPESGHVVAAMKAGARGYLAKTVDAETLVESLRAISRGSTIFDSSSGAGLWTAGQLAQLTRRELDVLQLVAEGKTNSEIADELCLAKKTVERIVANAIAKLRARNRAHAVAKAVALKVIDAPAG